MEGYQKSLTSAKWAFWDHFPDIWPNLFLFPSHSGVVGGGFLSRYRLMGEILHGGDIWPETKTSTLVLLSGWVLPVKGGARIGR